MEFMWPSLEYGDGCWSEYVWSEVGKSGVKKTLVKQNKSVCFKGSDILLILADRIFL